MQGRKLMGRGDELGRVYDNTSTKYPVLTRRSSGPNNFVSLISLPYYIRSLSILLFKWERERERGWDEGFEFPVACWLSTIFSHPKNDGDLIFQRPPACPVSPSLYEYLTRQRGFAWNDVPRRLELPTGWDCPSETKPKRQTRGQEDEIKARAFSFLRHRLPNKLLGRQVERTKELEKFSIHPNPREYIYIYILYVDPCSNISFLIFNTGFMHFTYRGFVSVFPRRGKNRGWLAAIPPYTSVAIYLHYESPEERRQRATRAILIFPKYPPYFFHPPHQPIQLVRSTLWSSHLLNYPWWTHDTGETRGPGTRHRWIYRVSSRNISCALFLPHPDFRGKGWR